MYTSSDLNGKSFHLHEKGLDNFPGRHSISYKAGDSVNEMFGSVSFLRRYTREETKPKHQSQESLDNLSCQVICQRLTINLLIERFGFLMLRIFTDGRDFVRNVQLLTSRFELSIICTETKMFCWEMMHKIDLVTPEYQGTPEVTIPAAERTFCFCSILFWSNYSPLAEPEVFIFSLHTVSSAGA